MARRGLDGVTPGARWLLAHLEKKFGQFDWVDGYREEKNTPLANRTDHTTRRALDLGFAEGDWRRAEKLKEYMVANHAWLGLEGFIWNGIQYGYDDYGYSSWTDPQPQYWNPPANWEELGYFDPYHRKHNHLLQRKNFVIPLDGGGGGNAGGLTLEHLAAISQNPDPAAYDLAGDIQHLVPEMQKAGITTKPRVAAFIANVCQETDYLKTLKEYGDERYFRSFLGDQWLYHGRGYIMNTWKVAYERLSSILGVDLVSNPDLLSQRKDLAARAATWFWTENNINAYADAGNFEAVCSLINRGEAVPRGPINGWDMRVHFFNRALAILPDDMGGGDRDMQYEKIILAASGPNTAMLAHAAATALAAHGKSASVVVGDAPVLAAFNACQNTSVGTFDFFVIAHSTMEILPKGVRKYIQYPATQEKKRKAGDQNSDYIRAYAKGRGLKGAAQILGNGISRLVGKRERQLYNQILKHGLPVALD